LSSAYKLGFIVASLIVSLCASAGPSESSVSEGELTEKLRFYATLGSLEADFHQVKDLRELGMQMKSEGRLTLRRPDSVIWEVTKPARVRVELGSAGVRITSGDGQAASVQTFSADQMPKDRDASSLHDLVAWLKLDAHVLAAQYTITKTTGDHFVFTPKKSGPFKTMEMDLSRAGHLEKLILNETSGDRMTLTFGRPRMIKKGSAN
jgi:outer membrane lipoprotein-sorting protein